MENYSSLLEISHIFLSNPIYKHKSFDLWRGHPFLHISHPAESKTITWHATYCAYVSYNPESGLKGEAKMRVFTMQWSHRINILTGIRIDLYCSWWPGWCSAIPYAACRGRAAWNLILQFELCMRGLEIAVISSFSLHKTTQWKCWDKDEWPNLILFEKVSLFSISRAPGQLWTTRCPNSPFKDRQCGLFCKAFRNVRVINSRKS